MNRLEGKSSREAAQYEAKASDPKAHCSICRHYLGAMPKENCDRIDGHVNPQGWCKFFSHK